MIRGTAEGKYRSIIGRGDNMKISDYTNPELQHFRDQCNFTGMESQFFELRARNATIEQCSEIMNVSVTTANNLSRKVNSKMKRV